MLFRKFKQAILASVLGVAAIGTAAQAQDYPTRSVEWVVPYAAGGGTDIVARTLANAMSPELGQTLVIINKPGAGSSVGAEFASRAKPDGYTILTAATATLAANPFLYKKIGYDAEKDFDSIGLMVRFPMLLVVNPDMVPATNLEEFLEWAKKEKEPAYASAGAGSVHHLAAELLSNKTGIKFTHIPYRGATPAMQDVMAKLVPFMFVDTATGQKFVEGGQLRAIAVASPERVKNFSNVPTIEEQGIEDFEAFAWQGIVAPAGTSKDIINKLNTVLLNALKEPKIVETLENMGLEISPSSPAEMDAYAASEREKWGEVIQRGGITVE